MGMTRAVGRLDQLSFASRSFAASRSFVMLVVKRLLDFSKLVAIKGVSN